ncbi:MAG: phosphoribosylanthranilate isomerase [Flavobacterium sp.]|uniref:phosphoribosylanthranilate isomerase n=1 Tax=Flavobacterium sp. TaxID=239 RepID=UPI0012013488|nr:phosphoribosylanthranilate isomerase [Flavobacterium sp.]RZJ65721.1 MAG: phosphoribosylanthranilate isomerase [Flavobacterium sp.]
MKLKVCGMKYSDNISETGSLLPDFLGFIFWEKSSRYFDGEIPELPQTIKKVGVFVDADADFVRSRIAKHELNVVQFHGNESVQYCADFQNSGVEIIKVFSIETAQDFAKTEDYQSVCDYFLFDTKGKLPGGNGFAFDWKILEKYKSRKPFFLSGGIGPESIEDINKLSVKPFAIDINSRFEISAGLKNVAEIKQFKYDLL